MNSDVPSSEHELFQDGSSKDDSNQNSVSSNTINESPDSVEVSDDPKINKVLDNDSIDKTVVESSTTYDPNVKDPLLFQSPNYQDGKKQTYINNYFKPKCKKQKVTR